MMDMIDQVNYEQAKTDARIVFDSLNGTDQLALCRELTIDRISTIIDKFPESTQREIMILLADKYLRHWQNGAQQCD